MREQRGKLQQLRSRRQHTPQPQQRGTQTQRRNQTLIRTDINRISRVARVTIRDCPGRVGSGRVGQVRYVSAEGAGRGEGRISEY